MHPKVLRELQAHPLSPLKVHGDQGRFVGTKKSHTSFQNVQESMPRTTCHQDPQILLYKAAFQLSHNAEFNSINGSQS